ncbi:uncharacterized protein LOC122668429 [Telopea speciosissima]|uniref:uncharacterized protein LOC122668429 n=1 Tax=Telopea speciosissima TaxID=54955 RepID=UPI001CC35922|nr:uncharacterized protein LOC122668429 [Telopea speciosissima]
MRLISWNCQGLGSPRSVRALKNLLKSEKSDVIFLMETKSQLSRMSRIQRSLKLNNLFTVDATGTARGLALLWHDHITIDIRSADKHLIDCEVSSGNHKFWLSCIYRDSVRGNRHLVWNRISSFGANRQEPWLCTGDFNSFLGWHEKSGGNRQGDRDINIFRDFLFTCGLLDLGTNGPAYTWKNRRCGSANIRIKLDWALANVEWQNSFEDAAVFIKPVVCSDHNPLLIDTLGGSSSGPRPFCFEAMWIRHSGCREVVAKAWGSPTIGTVPHPIDQKSTRCRAALKKWNIEEFRHL